MRINLLSVPGFAECYYHRVVAMERFWMFFSFPFDSPSFLVWKGTVQQEWCKIQNRNHSFFPFFFFQSHSFSSFLSLQILIQRKTLDWFNFYLHNRTQQCLVNDCLSDVFSLKCGVPRRAILDPLLVLTGFLSLGFPLLDFPKPS